MGERVISMIKKGDGKISWQEAFVIISLISMAKIADNTPVYLLTAGKSATALLNLLLGAITLVSFIFMMKVMKHHPQQDVGDIIYFYFGKYVGFLVILSLAVILSMVMVTNTLFISDVINTIFLPNTPVTIIYFLLLFGVYFLANRGIETIGRVTYMFFNFTIIGAIVIIFFAVKEPYFYWEFNTPILGEGIIPLLKESWKYSGTYGELVLLLSAIFPYLRSYRDYQKSSFLAIALTIALMSIMLFLYNGILSNGAKENLIPFFEIAKIISIKNVFRNIEGIFLFLWIVTVLIIYAIDLYAVTKLFASSFRFHEFEPLILPTTFFIFLIGLCSNGFDDLHQFRKQYLELISLPLALLPVFLFIANLWKKKKER